MRRRLCLFLCLMGLVSLNVMGCTPQTNALSNEKLIYATTSDVVGLSPILTNDTPSAHAIDQIYETLVTRDPQTMEVKPLLAESYQNVDPTTWVFKLRRGIRFHDGTPFNAQAVKYTFDKFRDPKTAAPRASLLKPVSEVIVKDDYTVIIKTKKPYGALLYALAHTNASIVSPTADKKGDLMKKPVGTGPYRFKEWVPGDHLTLQANPDYWGEPPKVKEVEFKVVPDLNTAISMLETGQVHFVDGIKPEQLARLKKNSQFQVISKDGTPVYYIGFNMKEGPTTNPLFRQAVAHAINQTDVLYMLEGIAIGSKGILGPKVFGYKPEIEKYGYPYNLKRAKELLKQSGMAGKTITLTTTNTRLYPRVAELVQGQLQKIGLNVKINTFEWGTYLDITRKGKFEMMIGSWANATADGGELFYPQFHTDNIGSSNRTQTSIPEIDKLIEKSREIVDPNQRRELLHQINQRLVKEAVWIPLYHEKVVIVADKRIKGIEVDATGHWTLQHAYVR